MESIGRRRQERRQQRSGARRNRSLVLAVLPLHQFQFGENEFVPRHLERSAMLIASTPVGSWDFRPRVAPVYERRGCYALKVSAQLRQRGNECTHGVTSYITSSTRLTLIGRVVVQ